jgi:serine 3-dehydrogenase
MYDLMGRTILITGASSGIGEAMARLFACEGARLLLCARRTDRLESLAEELKASHGTEAHCFHLDVRDRDQVSMVFRSLPPEWAEIDALVNNAGLSRGMDPVQDGDLNDWDEMIRTNVSGLLYMTRHVIPVMIRRGKGDIINIGSIAGHEVYPGAAVYCASKHAVDAFTRGVRMDLVNTPIRVIAISPGMTETEFSLVRFHGDRDRAERVYEGLVPLSPHDVAEAALFALTRPPHVQVGEMILWPTAQASCTLAHRGHRSNTTSSIGPVSVPPGETAWRNYYELKED